jgi:predicted transcriptional regulator
MGTERLKKLSVIELFTELKVSYNTALELKSALKYYDVLSKKSLNTEEMAQKTGLSEHTVDIYRSTLIKSGLIKSRSGEKPKIGYIKKL